MAEFSIREVPGTYDFKYYNSSLTSNVASSNEFKDKLDTYMNTNNVSCHKKEGWDFSHKKKYSWESPRYF